jgi:Asp-tRNA(Asn)/Glu-tRNA(Gln) amidotransferase A subunit family amidase
MDELAFYSVGELGELLRTRKITSVELTKMYISRIKKYAPKLECVITITEDLALKQAQSADDQIAAGNYRGPLHGIPFGIKDLLSTQSYKTTWGSNAYKEQVINEDAEVVKRLENAGAVLVAKLTLGELAMGDVWFGGMTRSPWDYKHGSGGSSAGPGAAVSAGLVAFAIGSETWGSIVDPSTICGITGLRPTYGRVSRRGAMTLCWSMDKLGPMCRTVEDCAIVFNAIYGPDGIDQTLYDVPFNYTTDIDMSNIKIGYLKADFDSSSFKEFSNETMKELEKMGAKLVPIEMPKYPVADLSIILNAECAAAFDELVRSGREDLLVRQSRDAWPNFFRFSRFIPAVEYIQANRIRFLVIQEMTKIFDQADIYLAPSLEGDNLLLTNLTGHPCVCLPNGFTKEGTPVSISLIGKLFGEAQLLAIAKKYQDATEFHKKHPKLEE